MINLNQKFQKKLQQGVHTATIASFENIENTNGGYLKLVLNLSDEDRTVTHNVFPKSFEYVMGCLKRQLGLENEEVTAQEILDVATESEFKIWVTFNEYGQNIAFHDANFNSTKDTDIDNVAI